MSARRFAIRVACGAVLLALAALMAMAGAAVALPSLTPADDWVTNGTVNAIAQSGGSTYIGGTFTQVGPRTGAFVGITGATGTLGSLAPQVDGTVGAIAPDGSGGFYIGGDFVAVDGQPQANLAHIEPDGTLDPNFSASTNSPVNALALSGSTLYVGGDFSKVDNTTHPDAAAVSATDGSLLPWNPAPNGFVFALAASGGVVYLGGDFTQVENAAGTGTTAQNYAAAVDPTTGDDTSWNPNPDGDVETLLVSGGNVYLGGTFTTVNSGVSRNNLAAVSASTGTDTGWNPNVNGAVYTMALSGSTLYFGGAFTSINGSTARSNAAAVSVSTGTGTAWNPGPDGTVDSLAVSGSTVYLGGAFTTINSGAASTVTRNNAAAVDASSGYDIGWDPEPNAEVDAISVSSAGLVLGGQFSAVNAVTRNSAAAIGPSGAVTAWNPNLADSSGPVVNAIAISGSTVYLGGTFTSVENHSGTGSQARSNAAAVDATNGDDTGWNPDPDAAVNTIAVNGSTVYLGGSFANVTAASGTGTTAQANIAAVNATTGDDSAWNPAVDGPVNAIGVTGGLVYMGGNFQTVNTSLTRRFAASVSASSGTANSWDPEPNGPVDALAVSGPTVYLGGNFTAIAAIGPSPVTREYIAAVYAENGAPTDGTDTGFSPQAGGVVDAIAVTPDALYLGGQFRAIDHLQQSYLTAVDPTTGADLSWHPVLDGPVDAILATATGPIAGGAFYDAAGLPQESIASFSQPSPSFTSAQEAGTFAVDFTDTSTDVEGIVPVSWSWQFGDGQRSSAQDPTHKYSAAGTYTVTLQVVDGDGGTETATQTVVVTTPAVPVNSSPPTITGTPAVGDVLTEANGAWTGSPASYAYQWEDCNAQGGSCTAIVGATSASYAPTSADVGSSLVVQETAVNAGGSSRPASSTPTGAVAAPPANTGIGTQAYGGPTSPPDTGPGSTPSGPTGAGGSLGSSGPTLPQGALKTKKSPASKLLQRALMKALAPSGRAAHRSTLLAHGGFKTHFRAPTPGSLTIIWSTGRKQGKGKLIAELTVVVSKAGTVRSKIVLTVVGKGLLRAHRHLRLYASGLFSPLGLPAVTASKPFTATGP